MFVIIDMDHLKMVAAAHKRSHIALVQEADFPDIKCVTCNANDGGSWSIFSRAQMDQLYRNTSGLEQSPDYSEAIEQLRSYVLQWTDYHKSEQQLEAELNARDEANGIEPPDDDPVQQQINANRMMRASHQAIIAGVERANAAAAATPEGQAKAQAAAKPAPKAAPMQGVTKRVWEIADAVYAPDTDIKVIRKKVMELAQAEGINPGTAATQYGRWKTDRGYA